MLAASPYAPLDPNKHLVRCTAFDRFLRVTLDDFDRYHRSRLVLSPQTRNPSSLDVSWPRHVLDHWYDSNPGLKLAIRGRISD